MRLKLLLKQVHASGISTQFLEVEGEHCLIGRKDCDVVLAESHCSRHHALLFLSREERLQIRDLQSTNGTYLNKHKVTESFLRVGDEIRIGQATLVIVDLKLGIGQAPQADSPRRAKDVTIVWTKEDTHTLREAAKSWPALHEEVEVEGPAISQAYVPGKGSRL